jgi:ankyrin repeat protein
MIKVSKLLCALRVDVVLLVDGVSPIMHAIKRGNREVVELLLQYGAVINSSDKCGNSLLHYCAIHEQPSIFKLFMEWKQPPLLDCRDLNGVLTFSSHLVNIHSHFHC